MFNSIFIYEIDIVVNRILIKNVVKKILKEDVENNLYKKIATIINPPYVTDMYKMGLTNKEILKVLEVIFGMELKIYGIDTGGDVFVHPKMGGQWIYFEEFDGSNWEVVERNEQDTVVRKYGLDGDDYYDQTVKPINLSGINNLER
jgi:hypothetical protein